MKRYEAEITLANTRFKFITDDNYSKPPLSSSHAHPNYELFYVSAGVLEIHTENDIFTVSKGELAIIPPALYHRTISKQAKTQSGIFFSFVKRSGKGLYDVFSQFNKAFCAKNVKIVDGAGSIGNSVLRLCPVMQSESFCKQERICALCTALILDIYDRLIEDAQAQQDTHTDSSVGMRYRYEIDELLAKNYANDIDLEFLAARLYLSPKRVAVLIRSLYGKSFSSVKTEMRIQVAKQLLRETDLTVAAIGEKVGYNSTRGFLSAFSKFTGKTPSEYRKQKR